MKPPSPRTRRVAENEERVGLLLVHTGDGKGKTTSAFGVALRAAGQDMRVHVVQFIKGSREAGEVTALRRLGVPVERAGEGFTWEVRSDERQRELAAFGMERAMAAVAGGLDVLVLDEVNIALAKGFLDVGEFLAWLGSLPDELHVLCTGRGAPAALVEAADLVTEHKLVKHPFERGIRAQRGVEF
ncbi:MAG: cob(I)yrinic acid a,c-diamide adenosyltransferase [Myxococcota bacterium]